jgi:hypothetical protein
MNENHNTSSQANPFTSRVLLSERRTPAMASWLVKKTVIKNLSQARRIIIGLIVFDFVAAIIICYLFVK